MSLRRPSSVDLKIVVLGPAGVGKTCVIHRFCNRSFLTSTLPTIGAGFFPHTMEFNDTEVNMMLWDTAGEERFRSVAPSLLRGANGLVLVFDISAAETFQEIDVYLNMFLDTVEYDSSSHLPVLLLGNKCDLEDKQIDQETMNKWMRDHNVIFSRLVSAMTGEGIEEAFKEFIEDFLTAPPVVEKPMTIDPTRKPKKKNGCC